MRHSGDEIPKWRKAIYDEIEGQLALDAYVIVGRPAGSRQLVMKYANSIPTAMEWPRCLTGSGARVVTLGLLRAAEVAKIPASIALSCR